MLLFVMNCQKAWNISRIRLFYMQYLTWLAESFLILSAKMELIPAYWV